jgi:hypothetical protein
MLRRDGIAIPDDDGVGDRVREGLDDHSREQHVDARPDDLEDCAEPQPQLGVDDSPHRERAAKEAGEKRADAFGMSLVKPARPAFAGECVRARTSSGYAIVVPCVRAFEPSLPA